MPESFIARRADPTLLKRASLTDPDNPFLTARYLDPQRAIGCDGWLLAVESGDAMSAAALCFLERGRLRRRLSTAIQWLRSSAGAGVGSR